VPSPVESPTITGASSGNGCPESAGTAVCTENRRGRRGQYRTEAVVSRPRTATPPRPESAAPSADHANALSEAELYTCSGRRESRRFASQSAA